MLSLPHLVVLFVIALVIFGPQKLPELARMLGKATADFRKMTGDFRSALEEEVRELDRQTRIREAETAASTQTATPAPPPGIVPRTDVPDDMNYLTFSETIHSEIIHSEPPQQSHAEPQAEQPAAHDVKTAPEKSPDDNPAV